MTAKPAVALATPRGHGKAALELLVPSSTRGCQLTAFEELFAAFA